MKHKFALLLALLLCLSLFAGCGVVEEIVDEVLPTPAPDAPTEEPQPVLFDYTGTDAHGNEVRIPDLCAEHQLTLVNFWATWCGPCVNEMPGLQSLYESLQESGKDVDILGIWLDTESPDDKDAILQSAGITYPILAYSAEMSQAVDLQAIPVSIFLDREGYMVGDPVVGARSEREWLGEILDRLELAQSE